MNTIVEHIIDLDADPFTVRGNWAAHKRGGLLKFDLTKLGLYVSERQKTESVSGYDLEKDLANQTVLNVNVLTYLLAHQELIPEEWKGKHILFWGTLYHHLRGGPMVCSLEFDESLLRWHWIGYPLVNYFGISFPALISLP